MARPSVSPQISSQMDDLCRLCALKSPTSVSVFSFHHERLIADMIQIICPIRLSPGDNFPTNVCGQCLAVVRQAYELRELSVRSDLNFRTGAWRNSEQEGANSTRIKFEKDPVELIDETHQDFYEEEEEEDLEYGEEEEEDTDSDYNVITPAEPSINGAKFEMRVSEDGRRFCCPHCPKSFLHATNVSRHVRHTHLKVPYKDYHKNKRTRPKEIKPVNCPVCKVLIPHSTNLKRHIRTHHSNSNVDTSSQPLDRHQQILESCNELTRQFFGTSKKLKYMPYFSILEQKEKTLTYECLLCKQESGSSRLWTQSALNTSTSNFRRHLSAKHEYEFTMLGCDGSSD